MKKTLINFRCLFFVFIFLILVLLGIYTLDGGNGISIAIIIVGAVLIIGYLLVFPYRFTFDSDGITLYYGFGIKTYARWDELKIITDCHSGSIFPWSREYHIGYFNSKIPFHREACIPKNKKTTAQIEKYYRKKIEKHG